MHWVQILQPLWDLRERWPAALLWRLWPWLSHVLLESTSLWAPRRELELSFVPGAAQRESISFWLPGLRSSSSQETPCSWCYHTSTQFPYRTQRHNPHPTEWTLKYRKRYLWYSLSLRPDLLGSTRTVYLPNAPDEISSLLCMVAACH